MVCNRNLRLWVHRRTWQKLRLDLWSSTLASTPECANHYFVRFECVVDMAVAVVQRQELYFRSVRQVRRFIHDKPALTHARLDGHTEERNTRRPPQQTLHPTRRDASRSWQLGACAVGALVILAEAWRDKDE